jgi:hypothetical protein
MAEYECKNWEAWHDFMPGKQPKLHVSGECTMPTPGYVCELELAEPQGINPDDRLLRLNVTEPTSAQPEVLTPCSVKYEEVTEHEYKTVTIIDQQAGIPVQRVE